MTDYVRAGRILARRDPVLRALIQRLGPCRMADRQHADPFKALIHAIVSQQLSTKAAATIAARFAALFGDEFPTPLQVLRMSDERLRAVGLSGQKIGYIRDLCERIRKETLKLDSFERMADDQVIAALTQVKGIGRWTAEMYLMFRLHRPDVLPLGDLGIIRAVQKNYRLRQAPTAGRLEKIGESWRPYRSVACWYLWASLHNEPMKD